MGGGGGLWRWCFFVFCLPSCSGSGPRSICSVAPSSSSSLGWGWCWCSSAASVLRGPARRPPGPASGAPPFPGMGDGILPPPPSLPQSRPSSASHNNPSALTCFSCHRLGHFQSRCTNPPFFLICRSDGHLTVNCMARQKPPTVIQFGSGLPGCAFFAFDGDLPVREVAPALSNAAIVTVKDQKTLPQILLEGLRIWDEAGWD